MKEKNHEKIKEYLNGHKKEIAVDVACILISAYCVNKVYNNGYRKGSLDMQRKFTVSIDNMICAHPALMEHLVLAYNLVPSGKLVVNWHSML